MNPFLRSLGRVTILGVLLFASPAEVRPRTPFIKPPPTISLPPLAEAKTTPWGKEVEGLSCRLIVPSEVTHGQPIRATVEIRNNSKQTRYLCNQLNPLYKDFCSLTIIGPDRKPVPQIRSYGTNLSKEIGYDPRCFPALSAGKSLSFELSDIRGMFTTYVLKDGEYLPTDTFRKDGVYALMYTYRSPKCAVKYQMGSTYQTDNGKEVIKPIYTEPTKDQLAGIFEGSLESALVTVAMRPMKPDDLTVHEWGVFTVFSDLKYANVNRKQEWMSLPPDFYRQFPTRRLLWIPAAWDKPLVYFYTKQPSLEIDVKVKFTEGAPVVWWPACASPMDDGMSGGKRMGRAGAAREGKVFDTLRWTGWLGDVMPYNNDHQGGQWTKAQDFPLPHHAWLQDARLPNAARFTVRGTDEKWRGRFPTTRPETERFIYYDGLVPAPDYLRCTGFTDAAVTVQNTAKFPIANLFFVDRRADRKNKDWAVAHRVEAIPAGATATIPLQAIRPAPDAAEMTNLARSARQAILDAGLYDAEADSILKIWHKDFFAADGLTAFWLLPQTEYDRMLSLEVTPVPANRPVRLGIAHQPHFEAGPRVRERVAQLLKQLESNTFIVRDKANRELEELGPWAVPQVREALAKKPSLETTRRLEAILQKADASEWLKQTAKNAAEKGR